MKETIILSSFNETELLRSLARYGVFTLGYRVLNKRKLAEKILMHAGKTADKRVISSKEAGFIVDEYIKEIDYFKSASYKDSCNIIDSINRLRCLMEKDEDICRLLENKDFIRKNEAIIEVFNRYQDIKNKKNVIDEIDLIREAVKYRDVLNVEYIILKEDELSPLELSLLNSYETVSLSKLFKRETAEINIKKYTRAYGSVNEVEDIFNTIYKNSIPLDKTVVAVSDSNVYGQLFYDYAREYDININFGIGISIANSSAAAVFDLLYRHVKGYYGTDTLNELISSDSFNTDKLLDKLSIERKDLKDLIRLSGQLHLDFIEQSNTRKLLSAKDAYDSYSRKLYEPLSILKDEISKGYVYLLKEYTNIRNDIDASAVNVICKEIEEYISYKNTDDIHEIYDEILNKRIKKENSKEGYLYITDFKNALSTKREYLFVCGLDASKYPGSAKEDYVILDKDYILFDDIYTSKVQLLKRKEQFENLISLSSDLNEEIYLSYPDYLLADIKELNPSSSLYDIFNRQYIDKEFKDVVCRADYENNISRNREIIKAYNKGKRIINEPLIKENYEVNSYIDREFSPTEIELFFSCQKRFFLTRILNIKEPEESDPFKIIEAYEFGNMIHELMEDKANTDISLEDFMEKAEKMFDDFLKVKYPLMISEAEKEKKIFLEVTNNAYISDPNNKVLVAENFKRALHPSGIKLKGKPDRIEESTNGNIVADYKTKKAVEHKPDDFDTCIQAIIYAYISEANGIPIKSLEYRYLRNNEVIKCRYDEGMKNKLSDKLNEFKEALEKGEFKYAENDENCRYCKLNKICGKKDREDDE